MNLISEREKLQKKATLLTIAYSLTIILSAHKFMNTINVTHEENGYPTYTEIWNKVYIHDLKELDRILGYKIIFLEDLHKIIDQNESIPDSYKQAAYAIIESHLAEDQNYDFRIFYDNLKSLEVIEYENKEDFKQKVLELYGYEANVAAFYCRNENRIYSQITNNDATRTHELEHVVNNWERKIGDKTYIYDLSIFLEENKNLKALGSSIEEAMDNEAIKNIEESTSYQNEKMILEFLLSYSDYDYLKFHEKGINGLINSFDNEARECVIAITTELDRLQKQDLLDGQKYDLETWETLLNECFNLCLAKIDTKNPYDSFFRFYRLEKERKEYAKEKSHSLEWELFKKYNDNLHNLGIQPIPLEELTELDNVYQEADCFYVGMGKILPGIKDTDEILLENGKSAKRNSEELPRMISVINLSEYVKLHYLKHKDIYGTNKFWITLGEEYNLVSPHTYKPIPIYKDGELLKEENLSKYFVFLSQDQEGKIVFNLATASEYQKRERTTKETKLIPLEYYLNSKQIEEVNINAIFNEDYLKEYYLKNGYYFENLHLGENGEFSIIPRYQIKLKVDGIVISEPLNEIVIYSFGSLCYNVGYYTLTIPYPNELRNILPLETVLKSCNILDENKLDYTFTEEELTDLILTYILENEKDLVDENYQEFDPLSLS